MSQRARCLAPCRSYSVSSSDEIFKCRKVLEALLLVKSVIFQSNTGLQVGYVHPDMFCDLRTSSVPTNER